MVVPQDPEEREEYFNGIKKTLVSTLMGIFVGAVAFTMTWEPASGTLKREPFALILIISAVWVQRSIYPRLGIDPDDFDTKDWLFLGFMTVTFAIVVWTLLIPVNPLT